MQFRWWRWTVYSTALTIIVFAYVYERDREREREWKRKRPQKNIRQWANYKNLICEYKWYINCSHKYSELSQTWKSMFIKSYGEMKWCQRAQSTQTIALHMHSPIFAVFMGTGGGPCVCVWMGCIYLILSNELHISNVETLLFRLFI